MELSKTSWGLRTMNDFHPSDNEAQVSHSKHRGNPPPECSSWRALLSVAFLPFPSICFFFSPFFLQRLVLCDCKWWCCRPFQSPYIFPLYSSSSMAMQARFTARVTKNDAFHLTANDTSARSRLSRATKQFVFNCSFSICIPDFFPSHSTRARPSSPLDWWVFRMRDIKNSTTTKIRRLFDIHCSIRVWKRWMEWITSMEMYQVRSHPLSLLTLIVIFTCFYVIF